MLATLLASALAAACQGPRILEADGAVTTGTAGGAGTGGVGGTAGSGHGGAGGAGGAACAAQLPQPVRFTDAIGPPGWSDSNDLTYFWTENDTPYITIHYSPGSPVASDSVHPLMIDAGSVNLYGVAVSNTLLVATWDLDGK